MSASTDASFRRVIPSTAATSVASLFGALMPRFRLKGCRQRLGAVTVWDGQAGFRLPAPGGEFFRFGFYVTFRRGPDDEDPQGPPPAACARPKRREPGAESESDL